MSKLRVKFVLVLVSALALVVPAGAAAQEPTKKETGYIQLPDGVELRYTALLPEGKGPFPVLLQYEGYFAGSDPTRANDTFVPRMLKKGYAVVGVSLRGSACSSGVWDLFDKQQARDGAFAVDWIGARPWSNGKVAMYSYSYGGIMQLWVAAERPKHLVAVSPANVVADTYRDIGYPGGILNSVFPPEWGAALNGDWATGAQKALPEGDTKCVANAAAHPALNAPFQLAAQIPQHPYDDAWHRSHSGVNWAQDIDVPAFVVQVWQDEETGPRAAEFWNRLDPERTWLFSSNGNHLIYQFSPEMLDELEAFYDHFLKGEANGFDRTPRVRVWHETSAGDSTPRSVTTQDRLPVRVAETPVYLRPGGQLGKESAAADASTAYDYPVPSPPVTDTSAVGVQNMVNASTWTHAPHVAAGRATFTTPPLARTVTTYGPSSADLWVSTTAPDVDLQITLTEVRPDGQEVYVQRGWLRASHRVLDATRSTALTPWHPHTAGSITDMPAGVPQLLRVDVFPSGHTFRAGSSLRMYVEQPSVTGLWGFTTVLTPQTVSVHHDAEHPSRLVLGLLADADVKAARPGCGALLNQACRDNPVPQPAGTLDLAPAAKPRPSAVTLVEPKVVARFYGRRSARGRAVLVRLRAPAGRLSGVVVELRRGRTVIGRSRSLVVGPRSREVVLRRRASRRFATGSYALVVRSNQRVLLRRAVRLGR